MQSNEITLVKDKQSHKDKKEKEKEKEKERTKLLKENQSDVSQYNQYNQLLSPEPERNKSNKT